MVDNQAVGRRIAFLRQDRALTQQQLAAIVNVSHQAVSKWESGAALPDIQTMLLLTDFFGITVEDLFRPEGQAAQGAVQEESRVEDSGTKNTDAAGQAPGDKTKTEPREENIMTIQQLMQMAPFMTKTAVSEIALQIEDKMTAQQIGRLAPFLTPECITALIEKHNPELTWDIVRRIAPFMAKESVDALARTIASGKGNVRENSDSLNRTINDIGKAFDDIGKGVGQAVQKALRLGGDVINEVSTAFNDLTSDAPETETEAPKRSDRALAIRKRAFLRALEDGNWEWIGAHVQETEDDKELRTAILERAKERGMYDWICTYMGGSADEFTIRAAVANNNWSWLGENAWQMEKSMQQYVALEAMKAENWQWLGQHSDAMDIAEVCPEICRRALASGAKVLSSQMALRHLKEEQLDELAKIALADGDFEMIDLIFVETSDAFRRSMLLSLADRREWNNVDRYANLADPQLLEELMDKAVDAGDFDAIDRLDKLL